jgi:hypothetical protein
MSYGYIYKIPFPNGKCYIGLTTRTLEDRRKEHRRCAKANDTKLLYKALIKYDMIDTFQMTVIDTAETLQELCEKEIAHIEMHNSHYISGNGYNMTDGGEGTTGYEYTEEDKEKMSEAQKKYFEDPEARQKLSEIHKKRFKDNPEARQKCSETTKKYFEAPEARQKQSEAIKKYYKDNPEAGKAHGDYMKKYYEDNPEARQQMSEAKKKYFEDPEAIQKNSEAKKKYFKDNPEAGQQMSEAKKKYFKDHPELRKKILDSKGKNKQFDVFKKDGTYIKSFDYQFEAMEYLQKTYDIKTKIKIGEVLKGTRNSSHGFTFKYKE